MRVVVVGAGIIGLAIALELREAGMDVTVLEQGRAMRESSWAAAGMLAVEDPENPPALLPLARWSRTLYPEFLERVERLSGLRVPLRTEQTLQGRREATGGNDLLQGLQTDRYGFTVLQESSLDPRDVCAALPRAVRAAGVLVREDMEVRRVCSGPSVELADGERLAADRVVLAGGAWTSLLDLPGELPILPVVPRKGQMLEVMLEGPVLPVVIRTPDLYMVPRGDGRVAIGATVEDAGFSRAVDEAAGDRLWAAAGEVWPPILKAHVTARWTGLRPGFRAGAPDALPVLGEASPGVFVAAGHFRNGILLAPGTARVLRELLLGEPPPVPLDLFRPERFAVPALFAR